MKRAFLLCVLISLCFIGLALQAEERPLATRVEHFFVASDEAQALFTFFKDTFQLPEVWPFKEYGNFSSGGLSLGNVVLEFASFQKEKNKNLKTEFRGIAFEPKADADETAAELAKRNIAHSGAQPYKSQTGGNVPVEWSSVYLLSFPPTSTTVFFCDYKDRQAVAQRRKTASDKLARRMGGPLGVVGAAEIKVGVQDLEEARSKWSTLLKPSPQISNDTFVFGYGPRIRLVRAESPGIQGIVLEVRSIGEAEKFLKERDLLARDDAGNICISPAAIDGLSIRLADAAPEQEKSAGEDFIFKTEVHVDLLFHALAHMDLGDDAANLYSEGYVGTILKEKQTLDLKADLKDRLDAMKEIFISDTGMGGLRMIDFLPFYITDYNEFIDGLNWLATDSEDHHKNPRIDSFKRYIKRQEQREFIKALSGILDEEYRTFYRDYWKREQERLADIRRQFEGFVRTNGEKLFSPVIRKEKRGAVAYLCLSMTRWGRGFSSKDRFGAAVKFPEKREEFLGVLITAVHEMTHQFSDALVMKAEGMDRSQSDTAAGSEGYRVHLASEYGVIYAEYLLFRKFLPEYLREYLLYFSDESDLEAKDKPTEELAKIFRTHIKLSGKSIQQLTDYVDKL